MTVSLYCNVIYGLASTASRFHQSVIFRR